MENDKKVFGIEIWITQETDENTHSLFRIYNTHEIKESEFIDRVEKFKELAIQFVRGKDIEYYICENCKRLTRGKKE